MKLALTLPSVAEISLRLEGRFTVLRTRARRPATAPHHLLASWTGSGQAIGV
ncbi:hypothetical protein [Nocardiopsis rhodophaea]|uniref:hypothetical protein n=1 Tax=Nocardiopsis rhodophaea TaxID=280238 RepID=UPI0031D76368